MSKKVIILGAGYAGVHAAKLLHKKYKKDLSVDIELIDKNPYHTLMTDLHEVAGNRIDESGVKVNLNKIFKEKRVNVTVDEITNIDFDKKVLHSDNYKYDYDYLIMGTGAEPCFFGVEGAEENSFTLWSLEDALEIKDHIKTMFERAKNERDENKRQRMLSFAIAGGGFTGVEMVGELAEWRDKLCDTYAIDPSDVNISIVEGQEKLLPIISDKLSMKAQKRLEKMNVNVLLNSFINKVDENFIELSDGSKVNTNTLIWTAGVQGCGFAEKVGLNIDRSKRIKSNKHLQALDHEDVYLVGDNVYFVEEGEDRPLPQIVETALQTAETAVNNVASKINNSDELESFESNYHGFMVSIGSRYAVSNAGGISLSGFPAMAMKHLVNLHYLWGVAGFSLIWSYLMHEIFHIKENRSLLGGHFANSTPNFWLVPLRLFIGYHWLVEGITKVQDGWLEPGNIFIIQTATDSGATEAAAEYASEPLLEAVPGFYQWILDTLIAPVAFPMQAMVVVMEIAIGLALIAGLFTFLVSIVSVVLTFNFILSAMAGPEILWYTFGSIALLSGAGRVFGLDYYVMPWLKKKWKNTKFARKTYLLIE
ncbi:MAG TPA: FAD-dependent oxidoreductase [Clostridia bacterium]|nr:FAD-dependent oxidoreductase [Clostridia bacterium]